MDWNALGDALIGGILGGGITGVVAWLQMRADRRQSREDRQYQDAEVVADTRQLLIDVLPERRGINLSTDPVTERQTWALLYERTQQISKQLQWLAAGRTSANVRAAAQDLSASLYRAVFASEWHARDLQDHLDPEPTLSRAQAAHAEADALTNQLEQAISNPSGPGGSARLAQKVNFC